MLIPGLVSIKVIIVWNEINENKNREKMNF